MKEISTSGDIMLKHVVPVVWIFAAGIIGCGNGTLPRSAVKTVLDSPITSFIPPPDSLISAAQIAAWFACNQKLDSLSMILTKSLTADATALDDSVALCFSKKQDTICARSGLPGGYAQYLWITDHLGGSANRRLFDSVKSIHSEN
jgi:hypothetical protein